MGKYHYKVKFDGALKLNTSFTVENFYDPANPPLCDFQRVDDMENYVYERNGYLYINGHAITNRADSIGIIWSYLNYRSYPGGYGNGGYIDAYFSITYSGEVVCTYSNKSGCKADRFLSKLFR